jgi:hypothetical protein
VALDSLLTNPNTTSPTPTAAAAATSRTMNGIDQDEDENFQRASMSLGPTPPAGDSGQVG